MRIHSCAHEDQDVAALYVDRRLHALCASARSVAMEEQSRSSHIVWVLSAECYCRNGTMSGLRDHTGPMSAKEFNDAMIFSWQRPTCSNYRLTHADIGGVSAGRFWGSVAMPSAT